MTGSPFTFTGLTSGSVVTVLVDVDGREYVDLVCSWGPLVLGHAYPAVVDAVTEAASKGTSFGTPTAGEVELAEEIVRRVAPVERVRLVSSGTEATMTAVRLARGFTGRSKIVKFAGCYHGHVDALLASAGSGVLTTTQQTSLALGVAAIGTALGLWMWHAESSTQLALVPKDRGAAVAASQGARGASSVEEASR